MRTAIAITCLIASLATGMPYSNAAQAMERGASHASMRAEMQAGLPSAPRAAAHVSGATNTGTHDCCIDTAATVTDSVIVSRGSSATAHASNNAGQHRCNVPSDSPTEAHPPNHHPYHSRTTCQRE